MAKKPMTKTQIVAQMSETMQVPKKAGRGMVQVDCRSRGEGDEADGPVHHSRNRKTREGATKGAQGTQSPDRRTDSNPEKDGGQVSSSESLPGRRRLTEEVGASAIKCW